MASSALDVRTEPDGSVVIGLHGMLGQDQAVALRQTLVHTVRKVRPLRLVVDLADVSGLDPINAGTLSALCHLGDDHHVIVWLDNASTAIAEQLTASGIPAERLRRPTTFG